MFVLPLILQNPRPQNFYGPDDWSGGDPEDDVKMIADKQAEWDEAYASLTFLQRLRYKLWGYF